MCDVYREECFNQEIFTNWLNIGLSLWAWVEMIVDGMETYWLSSEEKIPKAPDSKGHENIQHNWFLSNMYNCKQCFLLPIPLGHI